MRSILARILGCLSITLFICSHGLADENNKTRFLDRMTAALQLTEMQQRQLAEISASLRDGKRNKREAMQLAEREFDKALDESLSDQDIRAKFLALQNTQEAYAAARLEKIIAVRAILTSEQRKKFHVLMRENESKQRNLPIKE